MLRPSELNGLRKSGLVRSKMSMIASQLTGTAYIPEEGLGLFSGALSVVSTIAGGGIVGIPYAYLQFGLPLAIALSAVIIVITLYSANIYMVAKDRIVGQPESFFEMGYLLYGRAAIFVIASVLVITGLGLVTLYFIIFGDTLAQFMAGLMGQVEGDSFGCSRELYVCILGFLLLFIIFKKELAELSFLTFILFGCLGAFMLFNMIQLLFDKNFIVPTPSPEYWRPTNNAGEIASSFSVLFVGFGYQTNIFPIFSALKEKTNKNLMNVCLLGIMLVFVTYVAVAFLSIYMFGTDVKSSVLSNIGSTYYDGKLFWEAQVVQWSFNLLLICHIPFIFFFGKEGLLIIIDELDRKSISNALFLKLQNNDLLEG